MSRFVYFLPGLAECRVDSALLERFGLRELFRGTAVRARQTAAGPDGAGLLVCDAAEPEPAPAYTGGQRWARRLDGLAWTGYAADSPPAPEELLREDQVGGHRVLLGDRRQWLVPVARMFPEGTLLPETLVMGPKGLVRQVAPEYLGLWEDACRLWDSGGQLADEEVWQLGARALAVNYRLGADEVNALGLFTSATLGKVAAALVDAPVVEAARAELDAAAAAAQKKSPPSGPASSSGAADCCPATAPASGTCAK